MTLALAPPLENAVAALSPVAVPSLVISTLAFVAIVMLPALFVLYSARNDR